MNEVSPNETILSEEEIHLSKLKSMGYWIHPLTEEGFIFSHMCSTFKVLDAIEILKPNYKLTHTSYSPLFYKKSFEDHIEAVNREKLESAVIEADDISFLKQCPTLKRFRLRASTTITKPLDLSPLYEHPKVEAMSFANSYHIEKNLHSQIDCSKLNGLEYLAVHGGDESELNYNKVETLKTLHICKTKGKNRDLTDLSYSKVLDSLVMRECKMTSLEGIQNSERMQCIELSYNRSLEDISALSKVKKTLKSLEIDKCAKVTVFSVLEELENLVFLRILGNNIVLPNLNFLKNMKKLEFFVLEANVLDGDLSLCKKIKYVYIKKNYKHHNLKDKKDFAPNRIPHYNGTSIALRGVEDIPSWRRIF